MTTQPKPTAARAAKKLRALMMDHEPRRTGQELADLLNISPKSAYRRMSGEIPLDLEQLWEVAKWLDVPITELTDAPEPATP